MDPKTPRTIGRYEVERLLGQGGMGRVWLARDTVLGRRVAIKVLRDDLALPPSVREELVTRMRHEAQAAAAVSHPNIVTLYDMGEDDKMGLFLVFEYVPGPRADGPESLRDRLRRDGPLPLVDVAKLAREVGSALTFAHAAGVIHRDIKPENILFSRTGSKIADFGIARIPESTITRVNTVLGTPAYTSPEALSKADFGPASDQFAFAATLYEAVTGVRAFGGEDPIVTAGKVSSEPPPPLDAAVGTAPVVRSLGAALGKGVAKEVIDRFASCVDLGEAVARAIERPNDGPSIDALLEASSAPHLDDNGPASERIEIERTPLSSRVAIARRTSDRPTPYGGGETPARPSIMIRARTNRLQNVIAAIALVVLIVLIVWGKKDQQREGASLSEAARAAASAAGMASASAAAAAAGPAHTGAVPSGKRPSNGHAHPPSSAPSSPSASPAAAAAPSSDASPPHSD